MEYNLTIINDTFPTTVNVVNDSRLKVSIGEKEYEVSYLLISDNQINLTINGKSTNAFVVNNSEGKVVFINGTSFQVKDADTVELSRTKKGGKEVVPDTITPPMPSIVISIMVRAGDIIEKGDSVLVLSAMKMETTLVAPFDGKVTKVKVAAGDKVMPGQILIDMEK